jgi:hypothetical protein
MSTRLQVSNSESPTGQKVACRWGECTRHLSSYSLGFVTCAILWLLEITTNIPKEDCVWRASIKECSKQYYQIFLAVIGNSSVTAPISWSSFKTEHKVQECSVLCDIAAAVSHVDIQEELK